MEKLLKNPYVLVGAAGAVILLVMLGRGGSSSSSGGLASQQIASDANVTLASLTTQQNITELNDQTAIALGAQQTEQVNTANILGYLANVGSNLTAYNIARTQAQADVTMNAQTTDAYKVVAPVIAQINANQAVAQTEIAGATSQAIAASSASAQAAVANAYAGAAKAQSTGSTLAGVGGLIGGIAKGAAALFSFL
jgi:hypothetical protein